MHQPLLDALNEFRRDVLPKGMRLFHGCQKGDLDTDWQARKLNGSRKWLSPFADYAKDYAYRHLGLEEDNVGTSLLWDCELLVDVPCLVGSQPSLKSKSPWGVAFAARFPNEFGTYAARLFPGVGPKGLKNYTNGEVIREILITLPGEALRVIDIIELPHEKALWPR